MDTRTIDTVHEQIAALLGPLDGAAGVYVKDLASGAEIAHNADTPFPMASVVKVPILYELYRQVEAGEADLGERVTLTTDHFVPGSGVLQDLAPGIAPTLKDLATLMITVSDNVATDMVLEHVGLPRVEATMRDLGLGNTAMPMPIRGLLYNTVGLDAANPEHTYALYQQRSRERYIDWNSRAYGDTDNNVSTPRDLVRLLEVIARRQYLRASSGDAIIDIMKRQKYNTILPLHLPEGTQVAHKTGSLRGIRNDVGIVYAPQGAYCIAVCSKHLADPVAGAAALARVSQRVWEALVGPIPPGRYEPGTADEPRGV